MRYRLLEKFLILFCIIFLILIVLPLSKVLAGTLPANWDWNRPAEGYYGDGDGRTTDRDIALWTQDPNWFSDAGGWNPNNLIGKTTDSFYISSGTRDPRATINQRGAFCVGHLNSTGHPVIEYYTITNIVDVDTVSVFNKNVNDGKSNWAGWPGGVISYGTSSPNTIYNKVIWSTSNDGAANAVKLGYLATNSFINNEKINNSMSSYKSALQFLVVNGASSWTNTVSGLGLHNSFGASKDNTSNTGVMREAQDYLNRVRAYKFEDGTTGTPKVNISGEKSYIGPYKITTQEGNIVSAKVVSTDGKNTYSVVGISSSVGGAVQNISNITSGSSFYIVVNSQVSSKVNVSITKNFRA